MLTYFGWIVTGSNRFREISRKILGDCRKIRHNPFKKSGQHDRDRHEAT